MFESLLLALTAFATLGTPTKIVRAVRAEGLGGLRSMWSTLSAERQSEIQDEAHALLDRGVEVVMFGEPEFPSQLLRHGRPLAPVLFYMGDRRLFEAPGIGMCGARNVSELGLKAARSCGEEVSLRNLVVVSGYAKGVDTETHLAALRNNGRTVIVLAEGINHFRVKKTFTRDYDPNRVLVVSQFPPSQPWRSFAAMARNEIISGLGRALVVIEAGEKGGTRAAGQGALKTGKPLLVLDYGTETPEGNRALLAEGGVPVDSVSSLGRSLDGLADRPTESDQTALF